MLRSAKKLGEILVERGLITDESLQGALIEQERTKEYLGAVLIRMGLVNERDLLAAVAEQFGLPVATLKNTYIDWQVVKSFSASLILDYKCLPFKKDDVSVTIAITNPLDMWVLKQAEEETRGYKMNIVLVTASDMEEAIQRYKKYVSRNILK